MASDERSNASYVYLTHPTFQLHNSVSLETHATCQFLLTAMPYQKRSDFVRDFAFCLCRL